MEATFITQLLKGFCDHTQWKYAVFWKLDQHFPMTLTWENGYQKRDEVEESMWGDLSLKSPDELYSSSSEISDYSARLLMIEMSHHKYSLGEGVVGKTALARDHCWVSYEDILISKFDTDLITECPDEWLLQFACGIKTIVLVPVLPLGVLQFGSFEAVAEDKEFVTNIKETFRSTHYLEADITPLNLRTDCQDLSFSDLMHNLMDSLDESSSSVTKSILKSEVSTSPAALNSNGLRLNPTMLSFIQDDCFFSRENLLESLKRENENEIGSSSTEMPTVPRHIGKVEIKPNHMEEEIWSWSHLLNSVGVFGEMSNGLDSSSVINTTQKQLGGIETGHDAKNVNDFAFPSESELHKVFGSVSYGETGKFMSKCISVEETYSKSTLVINKKEHDHIKGLEFPKDVDLEYLLDAVVGNLCGATDDTSSISNSVRSLTTMPTEFTCSIGPENYSEESTLIVDSSDVKNDLMPAIMVKGKDEFSNQFTSSFDGNASLLIDEARQEKANSHMQPIGGPKLSSSSKKRTRVGNNQKSRPRDRQLIMDRMKQLRELVPEGGRCSIDNLLERTIKHMLYLRKITSQAEKLKRIAKWAVPECKRQKVNASHQGRSCAFDFESELSWPIVIEDLECSGHMLIEMICNEHGLFLDIARVIRKLDVTILKGILENRCSNSWACFTVEVPRGFHRMDVLCPLLHLLQLRRNPVSCKS